MTPLKTKTRLEMYYRKFYWNQSPLWKKKTSVLQFCYSFHPLSDYFTVVAQGTAMFKLTWLGVQTMEALSIQTRLNVGRDSAELWRMVQSDLSLEHARVCSEQGLVLEWVIAFAQADLGRNFKFSLRILLCMQQDQPASSFILPSPKS